jgi:hypothetical protein
LAASLAAIALHGHHHCAYAKGHGDDDDDSGDDSGDDDSSAKGDNGDNSDDQGEDEPDDAKDQPPVTAGGLFTLQTYPLRETERPLTMTQGITQLRASLGTDISAKGAFDSAGLNLDAVYGMTDNFELIGGLDNAYNFKQFSVYAGFEGALWSTSGSPPTSTATRSPSTRTSAIRPARPARSPAATPPA